MNKHDDNIDCALSLLQYVTTGIRIANIVSIGFDATCSLVVLDHLNQPLSVNRNGSDERNVIVWMDHRAKHEADLINASKHDILKYVGGKVSLEMQCPKLLWLKKNLPVSCWKRAGKFFDLPDFLTWKCTGSNTRSLCSVVCKWNYDAERKQWPLDFYQEIGLEDLAENDFEKIGSTVLSSGQSIGNGLTAEAAADLGLMANLPVSVSMIDAHSGALALLSCHSAPEPDLSAKIALICGTSTCHMSIVEQPFFVTGVWGPYKDAIYPNLYLHEAGQSATGLLLDELIKIHPAYEGILNKRNQFQHYSVPLNAALERIKYERNCCIDELTRDLHIWPDFHGNRSPLADATLRGMVSGLTLTQDENNLAIYYLALIQSLAYGTRHILDTMYRAGRSKYSAIFMCGSLTKNPLFNQIHADVTGIRVFIPNETDSVLLGSAILGASAAKVFPDLMSAAEAMSGISTPFYPKKGLKQYHDRKYKVYRKMLEDQLSYRQIMNE